MTNKPSNNLKYYSQHGEDYLLWEFFEYKPTGFFIEIGAFDGKYLSTTYSFERLGWSGLCIEANPTYAKLCKDNRPNSLTLNIACSSEKQNDVTLNTDPTGLFSGISTDQEQKTHVRDILTNKGVDFTDYDSIKVETDTLTNILENNNTNTEIDFISIDVEGHELEVLQGIDFSTLRPRIIFVEANSQKKEHEITEYLIEKGYLFSRKAGVNLFFTTDTESAEKLKNINIFCSIEKQQHPIDQKYSVDNIKNGLNIDEEKMLLISNLEKDLQKARDRETYLRKNTEEMKEKIHELQVKYGQINGELTWYKKERDNSLKSNTSSRRENKK